VSWSAEYAENGVKAEIDRCDQKPKRLRKAPDTFALEFYGPKVKSTNGATPAKLPTWDALDLPLEFNKHFASWCQKLIQKIWRHEHAWVFHEPVNWRALNIPSYPQRIKEPMDLGTISKKVKELRYRFLDDFFYDVGLVFSNAWLFNKETDDVHIMANVLYQEYVYWKYRMWDELQRLKRRARLRNPPVDRTPIVVKVSRTPEMKSKYTIIPWGQRPRPMYCDFKCKYMLVKKISQYTIKVRRRCVMYGSGSSTAVPNKNSQSTTTAQSSVMLHSPLMAPSTVKQKDSCQWNERTWSKPGRTLQATLNSWMCQADQNSSKQVSEVNPAQNSISYSEHDCQDTYALPEENIPGGKKLLLGPPQVIIYPSETKPTSTWKKSSSKPVHSPCLPVKSKKPKKLKRGRKRCKIITDQEEQGNQNKAKLSDENNNFRVSIKKRNSKAQTPTPTQSGVSKKNGQMTTIESFFPSLIQDHYTVEKKTLNNQQLDLKSKILASNQASTPLPTQNPNICERSGSPDFEVADTARLLELKHRVVAHWMNLCSNGKTPYRKLLYSNYTQEYGAIKTNCNADSEQLLDWEYLMENQNYKQWLKNFLDRCFDERLQQYREYRLKYLNLIQNRASNEQSASLIPDGATLRPLPPPEELYSCFRPNGSLVSLSAAEYSDFCWGCWQLPSVLAHTLGQ